MARPEIAMEERPGDPVGVIHMLHRSARAEVKKHESDQRETDRHDGVFASGENDLWSGRAPTTESDIQVADVERVVLDVLPARLNHVAHQAGEHLVGFDRVVIVQVNLEQLAFVRIHRGVEQLLRVHFAEAFEALDLHAATTDLDDLLQDLRDGEERMEVAFSPSPSISSKIG